MMFQEKFAEWLLAQMKQNDISLARLQTVTGRSHMTVWRWTRSRSPNTIDLFLIAEEIGKCRKKSTMSIIREIYKKTGMMK